jgi:3-oxoacyl-[acyl-carrier-protein] synthase-3
MNHLKSARIASVGIGLPEKVLTNHDLERLVETSDEWIFERTGIRTRRLAAAGIATSDLAAQAAQDALSKADVQPSEIDLIIVATMTPDTVLPATAALVQKKIGARGAWGFDLNIACSGFLYAMQVGAQFVHTGRHKNVLVIGADVMSSVVDYSDRETCILFGDAAGAVILQPSPEDSFSTFIDFIHEIDGEGSEALCIPAGGSRLPASRDTIERKEHFLRQEGRAVFRFGTVKMADVCQQVLQQNNVDPDEVDLFVPHQANKRIIEAAVKRLGIDMDKVVVNIGDYGNTTAATIPLALNSALESGRLKRGDLVLTTAMGGGFAWGACLFRY